MVVQPGAYAARRAAPVTLPRVVASDLDGTLLRSDGTVSDRTVRALRAVAGLGVTTVLVTARPPRWLHDLSQLVGDHGVAICSNGAYVYDVARREVVEAHGFARTEVVRLAADLRAALPDITFAAERASGPWLEPSYPDPHQDRDSGSAVSALIDDLDDEPVGKLLARAPGRPTDDFLSMVAGIAGERAVVTYAGAFGLAELNPPGVTKGAALERWCASHGVEAAAVWAFGDMPNDIPMLRWAGRSFAVANGHPDALDAATDVCPANDDDGVAEVLEGLLTGSA